MTTSEMDRLWGREYTASLQNRGMYQLGWIAALTSLLLGVLEIALTFMPTGTSQATVAVVDWFRLLQDNTFMGLRNLGLINIGLVGAGIILYLALYTLLRHENPAWTTLATVTYLIGAAVFLATNRAFAMLDLSQHYALATSEAQRAILESAGQAMLSVGQSHTPGTFIAFLLTSSAGIIISGVMLNSVHFSKTTAVIGIIGSLGLILFEVMSDFLIGLTSFAIGFAMIGGILTMIWQGIVALTLFKLGKETTKKLETLRGH